VDGLFKVVRMRKVGHTDNQRQHSYPSCQSLVQTISSSESDYMTLRITQKHRRKINLVVMYELRSRAVSDTFSSKAMKPPTSIISTCD
jgi:hypothetical protein